MRRTRGTITPGFVFTGSRGGRGRSSQGLRAPHERHLPSLPGSLLFTAEQQIKESAALAGTLGGILSGRVVVCLGGKVARFLWEERRKHGGRTAEDSTRTSRDLIWGMRGETISLRMPQHSFRARSTWMMPPRGTLPPFLNRAVLPPCFLPIPRDARIHDEPRRDPRCHGSGHDEPPLPPHSLPAGPSGQSAVSCAPPTSPSGMRCSAVFCEGWRPSSRATRARQPSMIS